MQVLTSRSVTGRSLVREEQYINPLKKNSFGPTEALCIDRQQCIHRSAAGFVVERRVYTPKVSTMSHCSLLQLSYSHQSYLLPHSMPVGVSFCKAGHLDGQYVAAHQMESQTQCPFRCLLHSHCWLLDNQCNTCQVRIDGADMFLSVPYQKQAVTHTVTRPTLSCMTVRSTVVSQSMPFPSCLISSCMQDCLLLMALSSSEITSSILPSVLQAYRKCTCASDFSPCCTPFNAGGNAGGCAEQERDFAAFCCQGIEPAKALHADTS